ncbi:MAG: arsenate reductase ArsC [Eubacteriales bacterium]|nr:arsenate reductase ArsC [Eubacteriales bacterium]
MNKKKVAFICVHNSCRSQMAEALGNHLYGDKLECYSAGTELKSQINQDAVRIVKEMYNIDMNANGHHSKLIDEIPNPEIVISMGCDVRCPFIGRAFDDDWGLADPTGKDDDAFKKVIAEIEVKLKHFVERI